ncbi:MAG: RNA polymerase sigma factor [bacterium]
MRRLNHHAATGEVMRDPNAASPEMVPMPHYAAVAPNIAQVSDLSGGASDTDRNRVRRCLEGDRSAFDELVVRHENSVFHLAWRILRRREDAEDVAQETFVRAWRSLGRFDQRREFRPWLLKIAVNAALSCAMRRRPEALQAGEEALEVLTEPEKRSPAAVASRRELLEVAARLTAQLPPEQAALFQLRYGEDLSCKEIAPILGKKPGAVAVALYRLRERLRRALFDFNEGHDPL